LPAISNDPKIRALESFYHPGKYLELLRTKVPEEVQARIKIRTVPNGTAGFLPWT